MKNQKASWPPSERFKAKVQGGFDRLLRRSHVTAEWQAQTRTLALHYQQLSRSLIRFDLPPATEADTRLRDAVAYLRPWTSPSLELVRYGGQLNGGHVMAMTPAPTFALSLGVDSDVSWERDMSNLGVSVAIFDSTIDAPLPRLATAQFHRFGLGPEESGDTRTLTALMSLAGVPDDGLAYLKLAVAGAEWDALHHTNTDVLCQFSQIIVELHGIDALADPQKARPILETLKGLTNHFYPIHVRAKRWGGLHRYGNYWMPSPLEVTYIRKEFLVDATQATSLRPVVDRATREDLPEIDLSPILTIDAQTGP